MSVSSNQEELPKICLYCRSFKRKLIKHGQAKTLALCLKSNHGLQHAKVAESMKTIERFKAEGGKAVILHSRVRAFLFLVR